MSTGNDRRDQGVQDVLAADEALHRGHRYTIQAALDACIATGEPFTADDVHTRLPHDFAPHSANLLPAVMSAYRSAGRIIMIGYGTSGRADRHSGCHRVWIGTGVPPGPRTPDVYATGVPAPRPGGRPTPPPACTDCVAENPAARSNVRFRVRADGTRCHCHPHGRPGTP